eukprot:c16139_g1_i1.p1 GENE.c16139_g1_i1~~c16139_g1_i1.p1  ORF type:complete len:226 (-),score=46.68 c16139_g1_i1:98-775(-)
MLHGQSVVVFSLAALTTMQQACETLVQSSKTLFGIQKIANDKPISTTVKPHFPLPRFVEVDRGVTVSNGGMRVASGNSGLVHKFAISEVLARTEVTWWKVKVLIKQNVDWLFAGIISQNMNGSMSSVSVSSFGWYGPNSSGCNIDGKLVGSVAECGDWSGWEQGDEAVMKLDCVHNTLTMKHNRKNKVYSLCITPNLQWKIHINLYPANTSVEISHVIAGDEKMF